MQFLANQALGRRKFVLRKNRQPPSRVRLPDRCPFFVHSTALSFRFFPFRFVLSPAMSPLRLNPIQVHFLVQRAPAYAQQSGGLFPIMPGLFQSLAYPLLFHAFPFQGLSGGTFTVYSLNRKYRSRRKRLSDMASSRFSFVAVMMRTLAFLSFVPPTGR